jgi:hypothetical protein
VNKTCILDIDNQSASLLVDKDINDFIYKENIASCSVVIDHNTYTTKWYGSQSVGEYYEYKLYSDVK